MAYAAVTSLKGTLYLHFLQSQPRFPLQHNQHILNSLHENLGFLQEFLEKSEIAYAYDNNKAMKRLEAKMRDVTFKAEERIEMELRSIYLAKGWTKRIRIKASLLRLGGILNEAVKETDNLKKKLIKISAKQLAKGPSQGERITGVSLHGRMRQRGLLHGSTSSQPDLERENNITGSKFSKNASIKFGSRMVGCKEEFKTIMDQLTRQSAKQLQVVSIVGMGGMGKTTLARKVYEDSSIISHFYMRAWVTVSQGHNLPQMLQCLLGCVSASSDEQSNNDDQGQLADRLRKHLKEQRYLIVMDDIWSSTAWDSVQRCFPDDNNGSRILLTSRLREVAEYASSGCRAIVDSSKAYGIWKMLLLRNFCVDRIFSLGNSSFVHTNLEGISWLDSKLCTKDLFTRIPNLKKLGIDGGYVENNLDCFYNFVHLGKLEELSIREWSNFNHIPCSGIPWATSFLPNLKKLKFFLTYLTWSDIRLFGMLPNLEVLKLKRASASNDITWEPSEEGFRQLKRLVIEDTFLERWNAVGDHFPLLECLELRECKHLREIPSGFADITTLALIQLNRCWDSVLVSAKLIQEMQYNNYGNALIVRSESIMTEEESDEWMTA